MFEFIQDNSVADTAQKIYDGGAIHERIVYIFNDDKEIKTFSQNFFKSKDKNFYSNIIILTHCLWNGKLS